MFPYLALWFNSGYIFMTVYRGLVDFSCRGARADSHGLTILKTTETPLLLLSAVIRASSIAPCIWQSCVRCSVFAFGVQDYGISWEVTSGMVSVCNTPWFDSGDVFGVSLRSLLAVACARLVCFVRRHLCRGAQADSHGPVQETIEFLLQLQYTDKVIDVLLCRSSSRVQTWRRQPSSHSCSTWCFGVVFVWAGSALCTGTGPGFDLRHQGGEGVAGTPGASSQAFCHPN